MHPTFLGFFVWKLSDTSKLPLQCPPDTQTQEVANVLLECGTGEQIMRWLAFTACSRLSYLRGEWG